MVYIGVDVLYFLNRCGGFVDMSRAPARGGGHEGNGDSGGGRTRGPSLGSSNLNKNHRHSILIMNDTTLPSSSTSSNNKKHILRRGETATWKIHSIEDPKYVTHEGEEYMNPNSKDSRQQVDQRKYYSKQKYILCQLAKEKFEKIANEKYGSVENLFATFPKNVNGTLTLSQFSNHLQQRNLDIYFTTEEQRLFFENYDHSHTSVASLPEIISHSSSPTKSVSLPKKVPLVEQLPLNDLIRAKISEQPIQSKSVHHPHDLKVELLRSFRQYDITNTGYVTPEALVPILDSSSLKLKLSANDIRTALERTQTGANPSQINYCDFVNSLDLHYSDCIGTPFFDLRSNQITRLKFRAQELENLKHDHELLTKREELSKAFEESPISSPFNSLSPCNSNSAPSPSPRIEINPSPISAFSPQKPAHIRPLSSSVIKSPVRRILLSARNQPDDASVTDLSPRVPIQPNSARSDTSFDPSLSARSSASDMATYRSVQSESYSPLSFSSREFLRPGVISDAERESMEREEKRKQRYLRTQFHLQNMEKARELDEIKREMAERSKASSIVTDTLRYENFAFTKDLIDYHKKPGDTMQRKPNPSLHQKIWVGSLGSSGPEDRDFSTTLSSSYAPPQEIAMTRK